MSLRPFILPLVIALILSVAAMTYGVATGDKLTTGLAAAAFALAAGSVAIRINTAYRADDVQPGDPALPIAAARRNARLMALVYIWGGAAMLAIYRLTGLRWRHDWQYAVLLLLIAGVLFLYMHAIESPDSRLRGPRLLDAAALLAALHSLAIAAGLVLLLVSGKLATPRPDWAANNVFVAGGIAVMVIGIVASLAHMRLRAKAG